MFTGRTVLLWGGSVRPAAQAVRRLGGTPVSVDWFADLDTSRCGPVVECRDWATEGSEVLSQLHSLRGSIVIPLGGTENSPQLLEQLEGFGLFAAGPRRAMELSRDPVVISRILAEAGLPHLRVMPPGTCPQVDDSLNAEPSARWLCKPVRGVAGRGIHWWDGGPVDSMDYVQEFREGVPVSATFLSRRSGVELVGVTRQLIGSEFGASEFGYAGNVTWPDCPKELRSEANSIGRAWAEASGLTGVFGVDGIIGPAANGELRWWACEVNPRLTAATELWERSGRELLADHVAATLGWPWEGAWSVTGERGWDQRKTGDREPGGHGERSQGKLIVYALVRGRVEGLESELNRSEGGLPEWLADVPRDGTEMQPGDPICTVLAEGESSEECESRLARLADFVRERFLRPIIAA